MVIKWFGHACFAVTNEQGETWVADPFDNTIGYDTPDVSAEVVTVSHHHHDHDDTQLVNGNPTVIDQPGTHTVGGFEIKGIPSMHDDAQGEKRGPNTIFAVKTNGVRLCHMGDIGHTLDDETVEQIGPVHVLFVPVGGYYTVNASQARRIADALDARIVIPMHFNTKDCVYDELDSVTSFTEIMQKAEYGVSSLHANEYEINPQDIPRRHRIIVMDYK